MSLAVFGLVAHVISFALFLTFMDRFALRLKREKGHSIGIVAWLAGVILPLVLAGISWSGPLTLAAALISGGFTLFAAARLQPRG